MKYEYKSFIKLCFEWREKQKTKRTRNQKRKAKKKTHYEIIQ